MQAGLSGLGAGQDQGQDQGQDLRRVDLVVRVIGGVVALAAGVVAAAVALVLVPLRLELAGATIRLPVAVLIALAGNWLLLWFSREATGVRWGVLLPVVGWFALMLPALSATAEGDRLLVPDDWVGLLTLFTGTVVLTIGTALALVRPPPRGPASGGGEAMASRPPFANRYP